MSDDDPFQQARGKYPRPREENTTFDPFVTAMWRTHRLNAPQQDHSGKNIKWVWKEGKGIWVDNPKPN